MQKKSIISFLISILLVFEFLATDLIFDSFTAYAAAVPVLVTQIEGISDTLTVDVSPAKPNVLNVSGFATVSSTISLNIDPTVTVNWDAELTGNISGKYILNLTGSGTFNLTNEIRNSVGGVITVTGAGTNININNGGKLNNPSGSGMTLNIAANNVTVAVEIGGEIVNAGSNSAVNVTAGVRGVNINVSGGNVISVPAGYAINDGGTALCANNTRIIVASGKVAAGSACAIKSTGEGSVVIVSGGTVSNTATVNSNPVIYMNGGGGDNVIISGDGEIIASDNNLGYGIQTTGNVLIADNAKVIATSGRAVNLVGMASVITVNGGLVTALSGVAICTATTNPATVANTKIIINGGVVSTTDPAAVHGAGKTIYATGANSQVIVNGGWVYTLSDNTEAIYINGPESNATVNGGWVTAGDHFAIEAYNGGSVDINGGFVFAYGNAPLSPKTGTTVKSSAIGAISYDRINVNGDGDGVVAVWDRDTWGAAAWNKGDYTEGYANHLVTEPPGLIDDADPPAVQPNTPENDVYWQNNGFEDGIYYSNGTNTGFFPLVEVKVDKAHYFITVINGTGTGSYKEGVSVTGITANPAPDGMEFSHWDVQPFDSVDPSSVFTMPNYDLRIEAVYKRKLYNFTVTGAVPNVSGLYNTGALIMIIAGDAPTGMEFDRWEVVSAKGSISNPYSSTAYFQMPDENAAAAARYKNIPLYTFILHGGTIVSGYSGPCPAGTVITIRAPSAFPANYSFSGWSVLSGGGTLDNAFSTTTQFIMPAANAAVTMNQPFYTGPDQPYHSLDVINGTDKLGTGPYSAGIAVPIEAEPASPGSMFTGWVIAAGRGVFANTGAMSTTFRMSDGDAIVRANYEPIEYSLFVEYGEITNGLYANENTGLFSMGAQIELKAVEPIPGRFKFDGWSVSGGGSFSDATAEVTVFTMPMDSAVVTANWVPLHHLTIVGGYIVLKNGTSTASMTSGYFDADDKIGIEKYGSVPANYAFTGWQSNNGGMFDNATATSAIFTMPANETTITANYVYETISAKYELKIVKGTGSIGTGGSSWTTEDIEPGRTDIFLTAEPPEPGMVFVMWVTELTNEKIDTNSNYGSFDNAFDPSTRFTMPDQDVTVTAVYSARYSLEVTDEWDGGTVIAQGDYAGGVNVDIAAPDHTGDDRIFTGWVITSGGGSFANKTAMETVFTMPNADTVIAATYAEIETANYLLTTVGCHSDNYGPFTEGAAEIATVKADVPSGKEFERWVITGFVYAGDPADPAPITFTMPPSPAGNVSVTALFKDVKYTLTVNSGSGGGSFSAGEDVTLTAAPASPGYVFDKWTSNSGGVFLSENNATSQYLMPANDVTVTASYKSDDDWNPPRVPTDPPHKTKDEDDNSGNVSDLLITDVHFAYVIGIGNNDFAQLADITRAEVAQMIYNLLRDKETPITKAFPDVRADAWYSTAVHTLASLGIVNGYPDGNYEPTQKITRAEFAAIVVRFVGLSPGEKRFVDVPDTHWAYDSINSAYNFGWVSGVGNDMFEPNRNIIRAEAVTIMNHLLNRVPDREYIDVNEDELVSFADLEKSYWAYYNIMEAANSHEFEYHDGMEKWMMINH